MSENQNQNSGFAALPDEKTSNGQPLAKVATKQIAIKKEDITRLGIPEDFLKKDPALVELILQTESMKDEERKYWFGLLPIMTDEQVDKLRGILQNEKDQLAEIDAKYESELKRLTDAEHVAAARAEEAREKRKQLEATEAAAEEKEKDAEADILNKIDNL